MMKRGRFEMGWKRFEEVQGVACIPPYIRIQSDRQTPNPHHVVSVCVDDFGEWRRCDGASKVMMC